MIPRVEGPLSRYIFSRAFLCARKREEESRDERTGNYRATETRVEGERKKEKREMCARYVSRIPNAARIIKRERERE